MTKALNISNELLPLVMKVMKYSMQPVLFEEPLEDFLEVLDDLDFLGGFSNLTKSGQVLMNKNLNPRVFACQYAREPKEMISYYGKPRCDLFHHSLTNGGLGYSFNQADFWDLYSSTWYTKEFAKIYWPKGFKRSKSDDYLDEKKEWRNSTNNIFYPVQSGQKNGLTVTVLEYNTFSIFFPLFH